MKTALQLVLGIGLVGLAFSGWLVSRELFHAAPAGTCAEVGPANTILSQPPCVYGFFMYLAIVVVSTIGLSSAHAVQHDSSPGLPGARPSA